MAILKAFGQSLPDHPYVWEHGSPMQIRALKGALKHSHIQFNGPTHCRWLVFDLDLDRPEAASKWKSALDILQDPHVPSPNILCINPKNGNAHLFYLLKTPVRTAPDASDKALRYCAAIERALCERLGADQGYAGLVAKNPLHSDWYTMPLRSEGYELGELADWFDLKGPAKQEEQQVYGLGRNCETFEQLRKWAYKAIRVLDPADGFTRWYNAVFERCAGLQQQFDNPLTEPEVRAIAKSVAKWVYARLGKQGHSEAFLQRQRERGKKGGQCQGMAYESKRSEALTMRRSGMPIKQIAAHLEVSERSVIRWIHSER